MTTAPQVNAAQRDYWLREGERWVAEASRFEGMNQGFGDALLEAVALRPGERVLDVGCGAGATSIEAARRIAPKGEVRGVDLSPAMLALARRRAALVRVGGVDFVEGDAQVHPFEEGAFDAVISRFGTLFFENPVEAFANLRRALRPGGRIGMVCWREPSLNEWLSVPIRAAAPHLGVPDLAAPGEPGQFAFAEGEVLRRMLEQGGFRELTIAPVTRSMRVADDARDYAAYLTSEQVAGEWLAAKPPANVDAAVKAVNRALAPFARPEGVFMNGAAWLAVGWR